MAAGRVLPRGRMETKIATVDVAQLILAASRGSPTGRIAVGLGIILVLAVLGAAAAMVVRKRVQGTDAGGPGGGGFGLSDLRRLHRQGDLTDEEFERAKAKIVSGYHRAAEREGEGEGAAGGPPVEAKPEPERE